MTDIFDDAILEDLSYSDEIQEHNTLERAKLSGAHKDALAAYNKVLQQTMGYVPKLVRAPLVVPKLKGTVDVSVEQWKARINALLYMVERPELVLAKLGFSKAWAEVSSSPYSRKLREYKFNEVDQKLLLTRLKDKGLNLKLTNEFTPRDVIDRLKEKYVLELSDINRKLRTENELLKKLTKYEFTYDSDHDAILYRGQIFTYSAKARKYVTKWNGTSIGIPVSSKEKMMQAFDAINTFLELATD